MSTTTKRPYADTIEDVEFILESDPTATAAHIAMRLGYAQPSGVTNALKAAGRDDLRDVLVRNAKLAGHNVTSRRT